MRRVLLGVLLSLLGASPCWAGASRLFTAASSDRITFASGFNFSAREPYTLCAWAKTTTVGAGARDIMNVGTAATFQVILRQDASTLSHYRCKSGGFDTNQGGTLVANTWFFACAVYDGTTMLTYLNGSALNSGTTSTTNVCNAAGSGIYGDQIETLVNEYWNGNIAYGHVYNRALSVAEINELMQHPLSIPNGLMAAHGLWGSDSPELDISGNGRTGTVATPASSTDGPPVYLLSPQAWRHWFDRLLDWMVPNVFADDVIVCNPTALVPNQVVSYQKNIDPYKSGAVSDPNSLIWSLPASTVHPWNGVVPTGVPQTYWKCSGSTVVEMSQAEKDAVDAPAVAEAARQQTFTDEITTNNVCTAELTDIDARIDALIDPVANLVDAKTAMKIALKKVARCLRARSR